MRNFKWYRKLKGGKWWYVRDYESNDNSFFWFHESECIDFPEFDGLFMGDISTAYWDSWFSYERGHTYYGWRDMENLPTEDFSKR